MTQPNFQLSQVKRNTWLILFGIVLLAIALRVHQLSIESYWLDEIIMVKITQSELPEIMERLRTGRPPIYVFLGYIWVRIFGATEVATRSLSVAAGLLSIPVVFLIGRRMFNITVGLLATFFTAISIFHIYYSQEYRYYSVLILFTVLMIYFYIRALETRRILDFALYVICSIGVYYSHSFAMFVLVAPGLHFLLQIRRYRGLFWKWLISEIVIVIALLPGLWLLVSRLFTNTESSGGVSSNPNAWITPPTILSPFRTTLNYVFYDYKLINLAFAGIAVAILLLGTIFYLVRKDSQQRQAALQETVAAAKTTLKNNYLLLLVLWFTMPILIPLALSFLNILGSSYLDRYLSTAAIALFLLLAVILYTLRKTVPIAVALVAYVVMVVPSLQTYYNKDVKEQWRELAKKIQNESVPQDTIAIAYADFPEYRVDAHDSFYWYFPDDSDECYANIKLGDPDLINQLKSCNPQNNRYWIIIHGDNPERMQSLAEYLNADDQGKLIATEKYLGTSAYLFQILTDDE